MSQQIKSVAILGGGFMGAGIAESASVAEYSVIIRELPQFLDAARTRLEKSMAGAVKRGKLDAEKRDAALSRVSFTSDLQDVAGSDLVIEAVPEKLELKLSIMKELNGIVGSDTILASNTSSIPIAELAGAVSDPGRVLGLHFFSPVPVMKLVEIVHALDTNEESLNTAKEFVTSLGKHPILTKDRSGFIVNFLLTPYIMGAVRMYEEGFASREDIDAGMKLGAGHPMGPLELSDFIGLDVLHAVCESLFDEFKRDEYAPPPLMKRMIAAGRLGRKSGRGFYEYND
ncbi:3-hydroxybutyryl-CoA dehydrogenase [Mycobacterium sp. CBMA293]|uniref:3-hydroxyacyl-CoA dehydrogenase family protein n=1 Tax=unclassified Mycolicibacterium TaxID=2636767 RepID=UPI0012DEA295|nr:MULTISPECIES: 3-hydroxybutyryl-CoA dehydrogenase [unclassified Mycolicibacterium]MUL49782.1 3-hydroxybutyryl-CoA dehydrogenase [Mycolicibacterium sp. CBMA 360]MUL58555.1 3-hydroxybutyryl-CoA dehydrogenase [Mycolicibacterium sp. CBMA 335]MUL74013.1 3-hydroxybutyryl-CoA dehydrogenase [Mycolicibacterium sp. CBMA 311]MUL93438.1 3-hydroxybutyryl-CoA dehydrogenase [Mycolicibacterium sp. CBMA 230]MUM04654.1 3-hydroxybutyryl-CoA dehydrogenase [Mycolicibacterium sp. CBMA 213]